MISANTELYHPQQNVFQ
uniref:Uncharacterized protein n=1 Tax=Rhizophora mucronata TaxID=61149 RepID=A0A2P2QA46_RHIMU